MAEFINALCNTNIWIPANTLAVLSNICKCITIRQKLHKLYCKYTNTIHYYQKVCKLIKPKIQYHCTLNNVFYYGYENSDVNAFGFIIDHFNLYVNFKSVYCQIQHQYLDSKSYYIIKTKTYKHVHTLTQLAKCDSCSELAQRIYILVKESIDKN